MNKVAFFEGYLRKTSLEYDDMGPIYTRPLSGTIGRLGGISPILMGTTAPLRPGANSKDMGQLLSMVDDSGYNGEELKVHLGEGHPLDDFVRVWNNPNIGIASKLVGSVFAPYDSLRAAALRSDNYNPLANSITLYNNDPDILAHELGHARDFAESPNPGAKAIARALPFIGKPIGLEQEAAASNRGMRLLKSYYSKKYKGDKNKVDKAMKNAQRKLTAAFGSYAGNFVSSFVPKSPGAVGRHSNLFSALLGLGAGHVIGAAARPFTEDKGPSAENGWGLSKVRK